MSELTLVSEDPNITIEIVDPYSELDANASYALVRDGVIVEYPVNAAAIKNRKHPLEWYRKVRGKRRADSIPQWHMLEETPYIDTEGNVYVDTVLTPMGYDAIVSKLLRNAGLTNHVPGALADTKRIKYLELGPDVHLVVNKAIRTVINEGLDHFAQNRGYDDILEMISYSSSTIEQCRQDAQEAILKRDTARSQYQKYIAALFEGSETLMSHVFQLHLKLNTL